MKGVGERPEWGGGDGAASIGHVTRRCSLFMHALGVVVIVYLSLDTNCSLDYLCGVSVFRFRAGAPCAEQS